MEQVYVEDKIFDKVNFTQSVFQTGAYDNCQFLNCNLSGADLSNCNFSECLFTGCNLGMAQLIKPVSRIQNSKTVKCWVFIL
jgi:fluoroquinolone resistance protein